MAKVSLRKELKRQSKELCHCVTGAVGTLGKGMVDEMLNQVFGFHRGCGKRVSGGRGKRRGRCPTCGR